MDLARRRYLDEVGWASDDRRLSGLVVAIHRLLDA
jgi:hypothetical protein